MNEDKDPSYKELIMQQLLGSSLSLLGGPVRVKEFLGGLSSWAGTSKDELVGMVCKEIGQATANTLKEPLDQIMSSRKLKITVELVTREDQQQKSS